MNIDLLELRQREIVVLKESRDICVLREQTMRAFNNGLTGELKVSNNVLDEAATLIGFIGTTGAERPSVIQAAEAWLKKNRPQYI